MRVVIAGGGIGGLATALSLHSAGITDVVVLEAAKEIRPLGVGINLLPHAVRELTELDLAPRLSDIGVPTGELAYFNHRGQLIWSEPRGIAAGYKWPQYSVHRGRLQMLLLDAVRERLGPDTVRTGHRVTDVVTENGKVIARVGDSSVGPCDLLIGADGIHSAVRKGFYPSEPAPLWNGLVLWRGTTRARPYRGGRSMIMAGTDVQKFVAYPISDPDDTGEVEVNWVAERPLDRQAMSRGDWNRRVSPDDFLHWFDTWTFDWLDVPDLIRRASVVYEYPMVDRDPLPRWTHGPVTLLGDAAHPMYPIGSNGASQAILDARVLASALARHDDPVAACEEYEAERRPATAKVTLSNRQRGPELVIKLAYERAPEGFDDVEDILPLSEREEIAARYKRLAGFDPEMLNNRPSYDVAASTK